MSEAAAAAEAAGTGSEDELETPGAGDAGKEGGEGGEQKKLVSLERHKETVGKLKSKVDDLQTRLTAFETAESDRKKSEMSETDRLKTEKAEVEQRLQKFEAEGKKLDALARAKQALAKDGKVIDPEKEEFLTKSLRKLAFDESTLDDDVAELAQMASVPKGAGHRTVAGKTTKPDESDRDPLSYTGKELGDINKESPERFQAIMAKRKQAIATKDKSGK